MLCCRLNCLLRIISPFVTEDMAYCSRKILLGSRVAGYTRLRNRGCRTTFCKSLAHGTAKRPFELAESRRMSKGVAAVVTKWVVVLAVVSMPVGRGELC